MEALIPAIFRSLRRMDEEANIKIEGYPAGLSWYGGFFRPELEKPQTEPCWTKRLAQLLPGEGYPCDSEVRYSAVSLKGRRCDIVATLRDGSRIWIEIKGAWKDYWRQNKGEGIYRSYLLHPLEVALDPKTHTVPIDLHRLKSIRPSDGSRVGCLLIGFDSNEFPMDADIQKLQRLAGLKRAPWKMASAEWPDALRPGCKVRVWFWHRPVN